MPAASAADLFPPVAKTCLPKVDFVKKKDCVKNRKSLEKKMTPSQIEEAQRLARNSPNEL